MSDEQKPTWEELRERDPDGCDAVIDWVRQQDGGRGLAAVLENPDPPEPSAQPWRIIPYGHHPYSETSMSLVRKLRLEAAEHRMRARVADWVIRTEWPNSPQRSFEGLCQSALADLLDAAATLGLETMGRRET